MNKKFGIVYTNGQVLCDPIEYDKERFADILNRRGANTSNLPDNDPEDVIECGELHILPSNDISSTSPDVLAYAGKLQPWTVVNNVIQREIDWVELDQDTYIENIKAAGEKAVDNLLSKEIVDTRKYTTVDSIGKYLRSDSPFYAECVALAQWVDACWTECFSLVNAGNPITVDEILAQMPAAPAAPAE